MKTVPATEDIAFCAFRYALGRKTYMVSIVVDWLIANRAEWSDHFRSKMVDEITQEDIRHGLGMDCDRADWFRLRDAMLLPALAS